MIIRLSTWNIAFLVLLFLGFIDALQTFLEAPSAVEVSPGKDILLKCKIQNRKGMCSWQKDNKPVGTYAGKYEWAGGAEGGTAGGEDCSLWVRAASLQLDDGLWQCQVTASSYDAQDALSSAAIPLSVRVPPQTPRLLQAGVPVPQGRMVTAAQGARTSVLCESRYGNPPASISWFLDDEKLSAWSQTNSSEVERPRVWAARSAVEIVGSRSSHGRRLSCRATHAAYPDPGYKDTSALLDVTFPPIVKISGIEGLKSLEEGGGALALRCTAEGNPQPSAWWTRATPKPLPPISPPDTLLLAPLARNHSGTYVCQAKNSMGESDPVSIDIDVKYGARVVWAGPEPAMQANLFSRVVMECRAEGNPPPRYLWTHLPLGSLDSDGGMPVGRESSLVLQNVSYRQQGSYRCSATNTISGRERRHDADPLSLTVVGPPIGEDGEGNGDIAQGRVGDDVQVEAQVCAEPPPKKAAWHWGSLALSVPAQIGRYKSLEPQKKGACYLYTLVIESSARQDARTYLLRVENDRGATTHAANLVLHENAGLAPIAGAAGVIFVLLLFTICVIRKCRTSRDKNNYSASELTGAKEEGLPADAVYSTKMYSPEALKNNAKDVEKARDQVYSIVEPRVQYDVTISRHGTPTTHLTVSRPLGAPPLIPVPTPVVPESPSLANIRRAGARRSDRSSGRSNRHSNNKPRPKSLQAYDNPRYLDHLFPVMTAEL